MESKCAVVMTGVCSNGAHFQQLSVLFVHASVYRNITQFGDKWEEEVILCLASPPTQTA